MSTYQTSTKTQQALIEATGQLAAEHGFNAISTRAIAQLADENIGSIHYHFGGKGKLFEAVILSVAQRWLDNPLEAALADIDMTTPIGQAQAIGRIVSREISLLFNKEVPSWHNRVIFKVMQYPNHLQNTFRSKVLERENELISGLFKIIDPAMDDETAQLHFFLLLTPLIFHADYQNVILEKLGRDEYSQQYLQRLVDTCTMQTLLFLTCQHPITRYPMTLNKFLAVISALFAVVLLLLSVNHAQAASFSGEEGTVQLNPQARSGQFNLSYPGYILPSRQAKLAFRVKGPLVSVNVQPGDIVEKGQVLMQIDPRDFEDNIRVLEAQLAGARAQQDGAERDFTRAQTLFEQHVSATADFDRAKSRFDSAFAGVQSVKAQLQIARHQLKDTSLLAPYGGVITTQSAENYEMVKSGEEVLGIQDISTLEVEIKIPENEIANHPLQKGQQVAVELSAIPGRLFTAQLKEWNTAADPVTRTYALRFSFPAPADVSVLPGMTAEVFVKDSGVQLSSLFPSARKLNTSAAEM